MTTRSLSVDPSSLRNDTWNLTKSGVISITEITGAFGKSLTIIRNMKCIRDFFLDIHTSTSSPSTALCPNIVPFVDERTFYSLTAVYYLRPKCDSGPWPSWAVASDDGWMQKQLKVYLHWKHGLHQQYISIYYNAEMGAKLYR